MIVDETQRYRCEILKLQVTDDLRSHISILYPIDSMLKKQSQKTYLPDGRLAFGGSVFHEWT